MSTAIKICGIRTKKDVELINEVLPDYAGFVVFFPKSKRNISIEKLTEFTKHMDARVQKTAVVVSPDREQIRMLNESGVDYIQIHGELKKEAYEASKLPIIKAFQTEELSEFPKYTALERVKGYVFDAKAPGSGETFDWRILKKLPLDHKMVFLAGGINADNVQQAINEVHPDAIDVSSSVEGPCGKDPIKVKELIRMVRYGK